MPSAMDPSMVPAWLALLSAWDAWLFTFALIVAVPTLGYLRFRRLQAHVSPVSPRVKLALYAKTASAQWFLVAVMFAVAWRHGLSAADLGEHVGDARLTAAVTGGLVGVLVAVFAILRRRLRHARPEALAAMVGRMEKLIPSSGLEMAGFALVSVTAGICEELLYRGWLVTFLRVATGSVWIAVGIGAAVFGVGHAYQGIKGILRTGFIGLQLALLFVYVDSLIPGQVLHAGVDLMAGFLLSTAVARLRAP